MSQTIEGAIAALREVRAGAQELEQILESAKGDEAAIFAGNFDQTTWALKRMKWATRSIRDGAATFSAWWAAFLRRQQQRDR